MLLAACGRRGNHGSRSSHSPHGTSETEGRWYLGRNSQGRLLQQLIPDVVLQKDTHTALIADAKYKSLIPHPGLGRPWGYDREDLYQLVTYLTEVVATKGKPDGWLVYPREQDAASVAENGPWELRTGQRVRFVQLPRNREAARLEWSELLSDVVAKHRELTDFSRQAESANFK